MDLRSALTLIGIALLVLACSPKDQVASDPWANEQSEDPYEDQYAAEADTLTYDFLAESSPLEEDTAPAQADLPELEEAEVAETYAEAYTESMPASETETDALAANAPFEEGQLFWVQVFASSNRQSAEEFAHKADDQLAQRVRILFLDPYYKVLVGGFHSKDEALVLRSELVAMGYEGAWIFEK